jgi:hypothetical protein
MRFDWERIPMSQREPHRYHTLRLVLEQRITAAQAAKSLAPSERHVQKIVDLAAQSRLPAVYPVRVAIDAEGLTAYQANQPDIYRCLSFYVDKIFFAGRCCLR